MAQTRDNYRSCAMQDKNILARKKKKKKLVQIFATPPQEHYPKNPLQTIGSLLRSCCTLSQSTCLLETRGPFTGQASNTKADVEHFPHRIQNNHTSKGTLCGPSFFAPKSKQNGKEEGREHSSNEDCTHALRSENTQTCAAVLGDN